MTVAWFERVGRENDPLLGELLTFYHGSQSYQGRVPTEVFDKSSALIGGRRSQRADHTRTTPQTLLVFCV